MGRELMIVLAIVLVVGVYFVSRQRGGQRIDHLKQRIDGLEAQLAGLVAQKPDDKIAELEKRIQVLEAIVTDKQFDLKSEIDSL